MGKNKGGGGEAQKASQKEKAKKREQNLKDKTFGLKNKNKSSKVQQRINNMNASMNSNPQANKSLAAQKARKAQKAAEEEAKREMELLFKSVKKKPNQQQQQQQQVKVEEKKKINVKPEVRIQQLLEGKLPDIAGRSLEDRIEEARTLVEKKTKMTAEIFTDWLNKKQKVLKEQQKKAKDARWKANRYTGKEIWMKFNVKTQDEEDAVDMYEKSSNPPSDEEDEDEGNNNNNNNNNEVVDVTV